MPCYASQVGNSVPPLLAAALSRCLGLALLGRERFRTGQAYVPDPKWDQAWSWAAPDPDQPPACVYAMARGLVGKVVAGAEEAEEHDMDEQDGEGKALDVDEFESEYDAPYADSTVDEDGEESGSAE